MPRRKSPNAIDSSKVRLDIKERLSWFEAEYATLASQRNMFAFLYNRAKASMADGEPEGEKMKEWRKECWRIEHIMRWLQEKYHSENVKMMQQSSLSDEWGRAVGLDEGDAYRMGL